jgi:tRNA-2-methylthio-N6-dimethylallyladenosine synthase
VPKAVVQERFERLIALQEEVSWSENRRLEGREVEVLVAPSEGRKDTETKRMSGRARDNRLVHFAVPDGAEVPRPGDAVTVAVTYGAPHHLVADSGIEGGSYAVRRTRGGDAWAALQDVPQGTGKPGVSLGMPTVGRPAMVTSAAQGCSVG